MKGLKQVRNPCLLASLLIFLLSGCATLQPQASDATAYHQAVINAALPTQAKLAHDLVPITPTNRHLVWNNGRILVVTWKSQASYEQYLKPYDHTPANPDYAIWVTTVPQVKALCSNYLKQHEAEGKAGVDHRLRQYLGLAPDWQYDVFVEMWVTPSDLFRPCVDPDPSDTGCNLHFGDTKPTVKGIADYPQFYKNLYYKSYRAGDGVPWTGIGYTYDWAKPGHPEGASEFIVVPGGAYTIKAATPTMEYCGTPKN